MNKINITPDKAAYVLHVLAQQEMESVSLLTKDAGAEFEREYLSSALFMGAVAVAALDRIEAIAADTEDMWCAMESIEAIEHNAIHHHKNAPAHRTASHES